MKVGMVGCGKLGLMVALAIESRGHEVRGYDVARMPSVYVERREIPFKEEHASELLSKTKITFERSLRSLCAWADIIFMAPQTPHGPEYEGVTPLPKSRADFNYRYLRECVAAVNRSLTKPTVCVIISTVLPGTIHREVEPLIGVNFRLVYEPLFIAMGTVVNDFLNPEFVLVGVNELEAAWELEKFYETIHHAPIFKTDVKTAEGIKVFYNTFITAKTVLGNLYGEIAHKTGMNVDDIYAALSLATDRLISPKYLRSGMGDGGGCHPRDNIALSWLARKLGTSFDFFEVLMVARERHCEWLADLINEHRGDLKVFILGRAFKPETNIDVGSPSRLLSEILNVRGVPHVIADHLHPVIGALYFIGTRHESYASYSFPPGSIVIDPFRYIPSMPGVKVIRIGEGESWFKGSIRVAENALKEA